MCGRKFVDPIPVCDSGVETGVAMDTNRAAFDVQRVIVNELANVKRAIVADDKARALNDLEDAVCRLRQAVALLTGP
jgi:hypothetical protein